MRGRSRREPEKDVTLNIRHAALERGMADSAAGRVTPLDEAFKKIRAALGLPAGDRHPR